MAPGAELDQGIPRLFNWSTASPETVGRQLASVDFSPLFGLPVPDTKSRVGSRELRVLRKILFRQSLELERSVVLWRMLLALSGWRRQLLYRAFILNEALTAADWTRLIGRERFDTWCTSALLEERPGGLSWNARVVHIGYCSLLLDDGSGGRQHAYCGSDSLVFLQYCLKRIGTSKRASYLDVGVGVGPLLCGMAPHFQTALGIDINPRAVQLTRLNVELNKLQNARVEEADVFGLSTRGTRYDVITWNVPYMFVPEPRRRVCNDGGELGIGLTIRFMQHVSDLLNPDGVAFAMASSPILQGGQRPLHERLEEIASSRALDIQIVGQWLSRTGEQTSEQRDFLLANGIDTTEVVILVAAKGAGVVRYSPSSFASRVREALKL